MWTCLVRGFRLEGSFTQALSMFNLEVLVSTSRPQNCKYVKMTTLLSSIESTSPLEKHDIILENTQRV